MGFRRSLVRIQSPRLATGGPSRYPSKIGHGGARLCLCRAIGSSAPAARRLFFSWRGPFRGQNEEACRYALRLLCWHQEPICRGWKVAELPRLSKADCDCLEETWQQVRHLITEADRVEYVEGGRP